MNCESCNIIRSSIESKIDDLEQRLQLITSNINARNELLITSNVDLLKESIKNMNDVLHDLKTQLTTCVKNVSDHSDTLHNLDIYRTDVDNKFDEIFNTIANIENCLSKIQEIEKKLVSGDSDISRSNDDISQIKKDIRELYKKIEETTNLINSADIRELPNMLKMYRTIVKYKYIIIGVVIVISIILTQGDMSILKLLHFVGL